MKNDTIECPNCHVKYRAVPPARASGAGWGVPYEQRRMRVNRFGEGASLGATEAVRKTPVSSAASSVESNFQTPLYISLASGVCTLAIGTFVFHWTFSDTLGLATIVISAVWGWQVIGDRALKYTIERITNHDLDGDGYIGEPPEPQKNLRVTVTENRNTGSWTGYFESPIDESVLGQFARAILAGRPAGERNWTGQGQPFSLNEYTDFRDELIERGLFVWKNRNAHQQGFRLTARGRAVFKELAAIKATTPPELLQ